MTGESQLIKKTFEEDPFFISGTSIADGYGSVLVIAVGAHSFNGKTLLQLQVESEDTPLQIKLEELAENIGKAGLAAAILMFIVLVLKYFLEKGLPRLQISPLVETSIWNFFLYYSCATRRNAPCIRHCQCNGRLPHLRGHRRGRCRAGGTSHGCFAGPGFRHYEDAQGQ